MTALHSKDETMLNSTFRARTSESVMLTKLILPKFSGDVLHWQEFWDQFSAIVDQSDIPVVNKFAYFKSLLDGVAHECIEGLALTEQNCETAKVLLTQRFGRRKHYF